MLSSWVKSEFILIYFKTVCGCICMLPKFWPHCGACGLDITKWHRWHLGGLFFECCGGERSTRKWPIFWVSLILLFHEEGLTQKTDGRDCGVCVCVCFHQPTEKEVIHKSVDTIQPWMCVLGARCHHVVSERQVRKRKTCLPVPTPPSAVSQLRIKDSGSMGGGRRNAPGSDSSGANEILHLFFRKNTNQFWYSANDGHAPLHRHTQYSCVEQHSPPLSPLSLSLSLPPFLKCWIYLPLAAIVMTPPIDPVAWKLVADKVVVRD